MYYEDTDLSLRLLHQGWKLGLNPAIEAIHEWENNPSKMIYSETSRNLFMKLNFPWQDRLLSRIKNSIEKKITSKTIFPFEDIGDQSEIPKLSLAPKNGPYTIEVSPHPLFIPAAYSKLDGAEEQIPIFTPRIWQLMRSGNYFVRITNRNKEQQFYQFNMPHC